MFTNSLPLLSFASFRIEFSLFPLFSLFFFFFFKTLFIWADSGVCWASWKRGERERERAPSGLQRSTTMTQTRSGYQEEDEEERNTFFLLCVVYNSAASRREQRLLLLLLLHFLLSFDKFEGRRRRRREREGTVRLSLRGIDLDIVSCRVVSYTHQLLYLLSCLLSSVYVFAGVNSVQPANGGNEKEE